MADCKGAVCVITSARPEHLGKTYRLDGDGLLTKTTAGQMVEGSYEVRSFETAQDLATLLQGISTSQAICASLPAEASGRIVTQAKVSTTPGAISRTKGNFTFKAGQAGLLVLDYDPPKDGTSPLTADELWQVVLSIAPDVGNGGAVWWCSGSSFIHNGDKELTGLRGQRNYLLAQDLSDTARVMDVITARCWLAGLGRVEVSESGALLLRAVFDDAMSQPARLDFIGGAVCHPPIHQRRPQPVILGDGGFINTREAFKDLSPAELHRVEVLQEEAKTKAKPEAMAKRGAWRAKRIADGLPVLMQKGFAAGDAEARLNHALDAAFAGTLLGDFELTVVHANGQLECASVDHILSHRDVYDQLDCLDPLNPGHRGGAADCRLYLLSSSPIAYSLDDGGVVYRLRKQARALEVSRGNRGSFLQTLIDEVNAWPDVFMTDAGPCIVDGRGRARPLTAPRLMVLVGARCALFGRGAGGKPLPRDLTKEEAELALSALEGV
jgi:hypothetical protein